MTSVSSTTAPFSYENLASQSSIKNPHLPKSSGTNPTTPTGALSASNSDEKTTTNANNFFLNEPTIDGDPKRKRTPDTNNSITKKRKINPVQKSETSAEQFDDVVLAKSAPAESPIIDVYGRTPEQIKPLQLAFDYMNEYCPIHKEYLNDSKFLIDLFEKYQNDSKYKEMLNKEAAEDLVGLQIMEHLDNILQIVGKDLKKKHPNLSESDSEKVMDLLVMRICRECSAIHEELVNRFLLDLSNT